MAAAPENRTAWATSASWLEPRLGLDPEAVSFAITAPSGAPSGASSHPAAVTRSGATYAPAGPGAA
ncbi:hypothetical protein GCM10027047_09200 [Rhodococcus aerolatus]